MRGEEAAGDTEGEEEEGGGGRAGGQLKEGTGHSG